MAVPTRTGNDTSRSLAELVRPGDVAMLTTASVSGRLTSRPLTVAGVDDERLRFLVAADSPWLDDLGPSDQVNVGVVASGRNDWVSVSGRASSRAVPAEIEELWSPAASAYFDGPDDPRIAVLELAAEAGEFWDAPAGGPIGRAIELVRAKLGHPSDDSRGRVEV